MSDTMLHGVLCMPPELWQDTVIDKRQRYSRYLAASRRIEDDEREIERLRAALTALDVRLKECADIPATAADAYDTFYREMVADALGSNAGAQPTAQER